MTIRQICWPPAKRSVDVETKFSNLCEFVIKIVWKAIFKMKLPESKVIHYYFYGHQLCDKMSEKFSLIDDIYFMLSLTEIGSKLSWYLFNKRKISIGRKIIIGVKWWENFLFLSIRISKWLKHSLNTKSVLSDWDR